MSDNWFYSADGNRQSGPVTKAQIEDLLTRGELDANALVWTATMADWQRAGDVMELSWARPAAPPPLPGVVPVPPALPLATRLERLEIHPRRRRNAILLAGGALFFGAGGLAMIQWPDSELDEWWGLGMLLLSALIAYATVRLWRRKTSMVLTPEQLEQVTIYGTAAVPWTDVEKIGAASYLGQKVIGLKLRTYDGYLARLSPELAGTLTKAIPLVRVAATGVSMLPGSEVLTLWSRLDGTADPAEALKSFGKVGDLAGWLMASRKMLGYDITFGWADFDRPVDELVQLLERYRSAGDRGDWSRPAPHHGTLQQ